MPNVLGQPIPTLILRPMAQGLPTLTNERSERMGQLELALVHVRAELTHQRKSLSEFEDVTVDFRAQGIMGELLEGFSESIRKWEIVEHTLVERLEQENA